MNNMFLEGPIQTGKSTLIRKVLAEHFGPALEGVGGFTCQRLTIPTRRNTEDCQRLTIPTRQNAEDCPRIGFRLMPAPAPIAAHTCVVSSDEDLKSSAGLFKLVGRGKPYVNLNVFETTGVQLMEDALSRAKSDASDAEKVHIILLDEIGGHEMTCPKFRETLYMLLDSEVPCIGVVKLESSARHMVSKMPGRDADSIIRFNHELHEKITGAGVYSGEILYYERGDEYVASRLKEFISTRT